MRNMISKYALIYYLVLISLLSNKRISIKTTYQVRRSFKKQLKNQSFPKAKGDKHRDERYFNRISKIFDRKKEQTLNFGTN